MDWWRRTFGLHPVDFVIHFLAGGFVVGALGDASKNDAIAMLATAGLFALYAWRRHRALTRLPATVGMTSGEVRTAEFEAQAEELHELRGRMAELEERLDFTERMLARAREPEQIARS